MNFMVQMMDYILFLVGGRINVSWDCCVLVIGFMYQQVEELQWSLDSHCTEYYTGSVYIVCKGGASVDASGSI